MGGGKWRGQCNGDVELIRELLFRERGACEMSVLIIRGMIRRHEAPI